jgi:hypothetical protein
MKGLIVSGNSGATGPRAFQFFCKPSLMLVTCSGNIVRLKTTAKEFASCGVRVVVVLSTYIPCFESQNAALNVLFRAVAFLDQAVASVESLTSEARSAEFVRTYERGLAHVYACKLKQYLVQKSVPLRVMTTSTKSSPVTETSDVHQAGAVNFALQI